MEYRKMVMMTLYVRQQKKKKIGIKYRHLDSVGEGKDGMI